MECIKCGNCNLGERIYYCLKSGDFVMNDNYKVHEKQRSGWKKDEFRKVRKEKEAQKV